MPLRGVCCVLVASNVRQQEMHAPSPLNNTTQLVFCRDNVDPDVVTDRLGFRPSEALKLGETASTGVGAGSPSSVGLWKLDLPEAGEDLTVEDQLSFSMQFMWRVIFTACRDISRQWRLLGARKQEVSP